MTRDAELERLEVAREYALERKQELFQAQERAWQTRLDALEVMHRAYIAKQHASSMQSRPLYHLANVRTALGPRLESLKTHQEAAYQNMDRARQNAFAAYEQRDAATGALHAAEADRYQALALEYASERRHLIEEIREAKNVRDETKSTYERARERFIADTRSYDDADANHQRLLAEFAHAKTEYDAAVKALDTHLELVRAAG